MSGRAAMAIWTDVDVEHPHLAVVDARVAVAEVDPPFADRLHLGAEQRHASFPGVEDVVVVAGLAVFRDCLERFLALGLGPSHRLHYTRWLWRLSQTEFVSALSLTNS